MVLRWESGLSSHQQKDHYLLKYVTWNSEVLPMFAHSASFLNAPNIAKDWWNPRKDQWILSSLPSSWPHKKGTKLYSYPNIIALLVFMFPKMNNLCCFTPVIRRHKRIRRAGMLWLSRGRFLEDVWVIDILFSSWKLSRGMPGKHKILTKAAKQIDGIRDSRVRKSLFTPLPAQFGFILWFCKLVGGKN